MPDSPLGASDFSQPVVARLLALTAAESDVEVPWHRGEPVRSRRNPNWVSRERYVASLRRIGTASREVGSAVKFEISVIQWDSAEPEYALLVDDADGRLVGAGASGADTSIARLFRAVSDRVNHPDVVARRRAFIENLDGL